MKTEALEVKYGLPAEVRFCRRCVISNQRPNSTNELRYTAATRKESTFIGNDGLCDACKYADIKEREIDWAAREKMLRELCDRFRSRSGAHDCIVPGSGGKDSRYVSHMLKYEYGMNPLTVTWPPTLYTDIGRRNFESWLAFHDNVTVKPNQAVHRLLTRLAFENLLHPFQPFIVGQRIVAPRLAAKLGIPLIFYGEPQAEYGNNIADALNLRPTMPPHFYSDVRDLDAIFLGGVSVRELIARHGVDLRDLNNYMPVTSEEVAGAGIEYHYFGYYKQWDPQEVYYYAAERTGFEANPERTEGTYSKYASLDDRIDGFHYYTTFIKFGIGRATYDAAQEIRNGKISREEGVALVKRYDGEFPKKYFGEVLEYMGITEERFWECIDRARSGHLWTRAEGGWRLRHTVY
jgi:N-acetyl sugar amidotransferase